MIVLRLQGLPRPVQLAGALPALFECSVCILDEYHSEWCEIAQQSDGISQFVAAGDQACEAAVTSNKECGECKAEQMPAKATSMWSLWQLSTSTQIQASRAFWMLADCNDNLSDKFPPAQAFVDQGGLYPQHLDASRRRRSRRRRGNKGGRRSLLPPPLHRPNPTQENDVASTPIDGTSGSREVSTHKNVG